MNLIQALSQLTAWRAWLNHPENHLVFYESFEIPEDMRKHLTFRPEFVLIYGRRKEFDDCPQLKRLREQVERSGQVVMTFDRLKPAYDCEQYLSVTKRNGPYRALAVPATMTIGPTVASSFSRIADIPQAIQKNDWLTGERRRFLIERLPYWNTWSKLPTRGPIGLGDSE